MVCQRSDSRCRLYSAADSRQRSSVVDVVNRTGVPKLANRCWFCVTTNYYYELSKEISPLPSVAILAVLSGVFFFFACACCALDRPWNGASDYFTTTANNAACCCVKRMLVGWEASGLSMLYQV